MTGRNPASDELTIVLWQCEPLPTDTDNPVQVNLARLEQRLAETAGQADLVVTPEMFLCGYHLDAARARDRADPPDGPLAQRIAQLCAEYGVALLYGCAEIDAAGSVFNAIRLVDETGRALATHRKTHLFGDLDAAMVTPGDAAPPVADLDGWGIGMLICYEVEFAEMVRSLAIRGADIVCVPTANMPEYTDVQRILLPARALESQVYVAYANYIGTEDGLAYGGHSEVVAPSGVVLAIAHAEEQLLTVTARRAELTESREKYPYLADRHPELY